LGEEEAVTYQRGPFVWVGDGWLVDQKKKKKKKKKKKEKKKKKKTL